MYSDFSDTFFYTKNYDNQWYILMSNDYTILFDVYTQKIRNFQYKNANCTKIQSKN